MDCLEVAHVLRQFAPSYLERFGAAILPSHRRAILDILACRTQAMGGHVYRCQDCGEVFHVYHACRNRACPACHARQSEAWLAARTAELLPCPYYHVCVTVPAELRQVFRAHQSDCYGLLMKAAAQALTALCNDKRYMGATPAVLAVLHTWSATLDYHPHVHLLVSGGGIDQHGAIWREAKHPFLVPVRALSKLVCGKFRALLKKHRPDLDAQLPGKVWSKSWVAWSKHWGQGQTTVLAYLARYVHRIAITNHRIVAMDHNTVTLRYKHRKSAQWRTCTLKGHEFIRRFLQHVLPKGLHKVRYYGLWHPAKRPQRQNARRVLQLAKPPDTKHTDATPNTTPVFAATPQPQSQELPGPTCPHCRSQATRHLRILQPQPPDRPARASPTKAR